MIKSNTTAYCADSKNEIMDLTFILSALVFTLLAIVVATSLFAKSYIGSSTRETKAGGLDRPVPSPGQKKQAVEVEDCTALSTARSQDDPKMSSVSSLLS